MLYDSFNKVYTKFKMHFYKEVFKKWRDREATLTTVETFCMEIIHALGKPTVSEFASFTSLSSANAADKINNLVKKGYLNKVQSEEDKRIYYLENTLTIIILVTSILKKLWRNWKTALLRRKIKLWRKC